jgi:hypothetical protein
MPCQNDLLTGLGAANELGQLGLRLADRHFPGSFAPNFHEGHLDHLMVQIKLIYSHSTIPSNHNAMIREFFVRLTKNRLLDPSEIRGSRRLGILCCM